MTFDSPYVLDWIAVIGPVPSPTPSGVITTPHDKTRVLDRQYEFGGLRMQSNSEPLIEYLRADPKSLAGVSIFSSWPILIEGSDTGDHQIGTRRQATSRIIPLVQLLSLIWDEPWQIRSAPWHRSYVSDPVGPSWPPPSEYRGMLRPIELPPNPVELPSWMPDALQSVKSDDLFQGAAGSWHQGILMEAEHSTFALVAYIAAIEAISQTRWAQTTYGVEPDMGSRKRVIRSLEYVCTTDQFEFLAQAIDVYGDRSRAAHGGTLMGLESIYGAVLDLGPEPGRLLMVEDENAENDSIQSFVLRVVPLIRSISRQLVIEAITTRGGSSQDRSTGD